MLGSYSTVMYEMLSGKTINIYFIRAFWLRYTITLSCLVSICCVLILWKKYTSRNQVIQINLDQNEEETAFNNNTHNKPILNVHEVTFGIGMVMLICIFFVLPNITDRESDYSPHYQMLYTEIVSETLISIILPLYIMIKKEAMRNFLLNEIRNYVL